MGYFGQFLSHHFLDEDASTIINQRKREKERFHKIKSESIPSL